MEEAEALEDPQIADASARLEASPGNGEAPLSSKTPKPISNRIVSADLQIRNLCFGLQSPSFCPVKALRNVLLGWSAAAECKHLFLNSARFVSIACVTLYMSSECSKRLLFPVS